MMRSSAFFVSLFILLVVAGCSHRPKGMPETLPCRIVVVNDGVPQADYFVLLHLTTGNGALSITARTNSSGVAEIQTCMADYTAMGAPAGTYKVTVDKPVELPPDGVDATHLSPADLAVYHGKRKAEMEKLRIVPIHLTQPNTTPFGFTLEKGGESQWTFDLKEHLQ
jgi:hypothetical protein